MPSAEEKSAFSQRLQSAIKQFASKQLAFSPTAKPIKGGADLARQFNLKHSGESGVSVQAVHKWLHGEAIPRQDKIKTLAAWLGVSEHWLHYGPPPASPVNQKKTHSDMQYTSSPEVAALASRITALPERQRYLVEELVAELYDRLPC